MRAIHLPLILSIALPMLAPRMANAQMGTGAPGPKSGIVMMPDVQKELKITGDQKKQLQQAVSSASAGNMSMSSAMTMDMAGINKQMDSQVLGSLNPDQMARLTELWIQYNGIRVLQDPDVAKQLSLTDDQNTKIKAIWDEYTQVFMDDARHAMSTKFSATKKKKKECEAACLALLTDDQNKAYIAMQGKQFKFQMKNDF